MPEPSDTLIHTIRIALARVDSLKHMRAAVDPHKTKAMQNSELDKIAQIVGEELVKRREQQNARSKKPGAKG